MINDRAWRPRVQRWTRAWMREFLCVLPMACACAMLLAACGPKKQDTASSPQETAVPHRQNAIRSTEDLRRLLVPAMRTNQIVTALGSPQWVEADGEHLAVWHYGLQAIPADDKMQRAYVVGVALGITNGQLAYWGCDYAGGPGGKVKQREPVLPATGASGATKDVSNQAPTLKFFVISGVPVPDGRLIDTKLFPKLGFIPPATSFVVSKLKDVVLEQRESSASQAGTVWSFRVQLTAEDATKLASLTATNISKQILIMVCDEPVSAPTIRAPLETGSFVIECNDRSLAEEIKKQLAKMQRQG